MPYMIQKMNGKWAVFTQGDDKKPKGNPHGAFDTEDIAKQQMAALYGNVKGVKSMIVADDGTPFQVGDVCACDCWMMSPMPPNMTGMHCGCLCIIRAVDAQNNACTCECLDVNLQPNGFQCTCPLVCCRKYNVAVGGNKSMLVADDGKPWQVGDVCACSSYNMPMSGAGNACLCVIRSIVNQQCTCECLDIDLKPMGMVCTCTLDECCKYNLAVAENTMKSHIEVITERPATGASGVEYKSIAGVIPQSINGRTVDGIAAVMGNIDDVGDITHKGAFKKTIQEQAARIMFTFNHEIMDTPRARIDELKEISREDLPIQIKSNFPEATGGLFVRRTYLETPRGEEAFQGVTSGAIGQMSYGYRAIKKDYEKIDGKSVRNLREVRLIDICDTTYGINAATMSMKGALPYHETPTAAEDVAWDASAEVGKADVDALKIMCAWVDSERAEDKSAYKLPHHKADGDHAVVWDGVAAAMTALLGGRGGVDIPEGDRKAVYNHLAKHYEQFGKEAPEYKSLELAWSVRDARILLASGVNFKAGRMISAANEAKIREVIDALEKGLESLENLLGTAEPPAEEQQEFVNVSGKALTDAAAMLALLDLQLTEVQFLSEVK